MEIIYCGTGRNQFDYIAYNSGFKFGMRLPDSKSNSLPLFFCDQDWKKPNRDEYIKAIKLHSPVMCTVLDLEREEQYDEVLSWAREVCNFHFVRTVIIIPKVNLISELPLKLCEKEVRLGYSVPTKYGKTDLPVELFKGRAVHLLGGSPHKQLELARELEVVSVDCNYHAMKANKFGEYWTGKLNGETIQWLQPEVSREIRARVAFELSCRNIIKAWSYYALSDSKEI